jgi:hypothetical protein
VKRDLFMHALCCAAARNGVVSPTEPREEQFPSRRSFVLSRRQPCIKRRKVPWFRGWDMCASVRVRVSDLAGAAGCCSAVSKGLLHACS